MLLLRIRNTRDKKPDNEFSDNKDGRSNLYFKKISHYFLHKRGCIKFWCNLCFICWMIKNFECLAAQRISFSILSFL